MSDMAGSGAQRAMRIGEWPLPTALAPFNAVHLDNRL
jgi:hypothetical protein